MDTELQEKLKRLDAELAAMDSAVIAFSGGVDSTFLAAEAYKVLGDKAQAFTVSSPTLPQSEIEDAKRFAAQIGVGFFRHAGRNRGSHAAAACD